MILAELSVQKQDTWAGDAITPQFSIALNLTSRETATVPVAIARFAQQYEVLHGQMQTRVEIRELHERLKATSVFVTHDQVEAMTLADRIVLLEAGTIQQVGSPLDLCNRPANVFVAGFIGSPQMNLLPAEVIAGEGEPRAALTGLDGVVPLGAPAAPPGSTILIGCRPEHTELTAPDFAGAFIKGEVLAVERLGSETHVYVRAGDQRFCASTRDPIELRAHDRVGLRPQTERLHLFDAKTGIRIPA